MLREKPTRVRCPIGGFAPCVDDMCHGGDRTMCGLEVGDHEDADVCWHGWVPMTCPEGCAERDDDYDFDFDDSYEVAAGSSVEG